MNIRKLDSSSQKVVRTKEIVALFTCRICYKLQKEATTISECLHTFCKECIWKKILNEKIRSCPVCGMDLGCNPLQKLRPDRAKDNLKEHIFGAQRRTPEECGAKHQIKEASKEQRHPAQTKKANPRPKAAPPSTTKSLITIADSPKKPAAHNRSKGKTAKPLEEMDDLWEPLNLLVDLDAADQGPRYMTRSQSRPNSSIKIRSPPASPPRAIIDEKEKFSKGKGKMPLEVMPVKKRWKGKSHVPLPEANLAMEAEKSDKETSVILRSERRTVTPQAVVDAWRKPADRKFDKLWIKFQPYVNKQGMPPLPRLAEENVMTSFKDGCGCVSGIQKFIASRLGHNEDEIDIFLGDDLLPPSLLIEHVVAIWLSTMGPAWRTVKIGSSGEEVMMILSYGLSGKRK